MIPKIIHYCWFGRNPKSELAEKCIASWKKTCPDFELREWNEDNFDLSAAPLYVRQAYEAGKWAFVTDYVRLWALTRFGGVYMDTDVELVKPLTPFLRHRAFGGFETDSAISTGMMACAPGFELFLEFMRRYDDLTFYTPEGALNLTTNVETVTGICLSKGLIPNGQLQQVEGLWLYPREVFSPVDFETGRLRRTGKTVAIHWFSGSWYTQEEARRREELRRKARRDQAAEPLRRWVRNALGEDGWERWAERLHRYRSWEQIRRMPRRIWRKLLGKPNED